MFHVVARTGVDPGVVDVFAVVLQSEIRERGYEVIGRGDVEALLGLERTREALGCELTSCLTELAGSMGVDEMITGDLARVGTTLVVSVRRLDARSGKVLKDWVKRLDGGADNVFLAWTAPMVAALYGPRATDAKVTTTGPVVDHGASAVAAPLTPTSNVAPDSATQTPVHTKAWFWITILGATVTVAGGIAIGVAVGTKPQVFGVLTF